MQKYLANSEIIDWNNPTVLVKAQELAKGCSSSSEIAKSCYEFVPMIFSIVGIINLILLPVRHPKY